MRLSNVSVLLAAILTAPIASAQTHTVFHSVVSAGKTIAGTHKTGRDKNGLHFTFEYNDRGTGPKISEDLELDSAGFPESTILRGNNYRNGRVDEKFTTDNGKAS